tara:strand:+ start:676 stop:819 length:144 start_codon:yes stop_codon:yes gene_type:complete
VGAAGDLLANYQHVIEDLRLVTAENGVFDVTVDNVILLLQRRNRTAR